MAYECDNCKDHDDYFLCSGCVTEKEEKALKEGFEEGKKEAEESKTNEDL